MAERVEIRLIGEGWRPLPEGLDFERLRTLSDSEWVDLGHGFWCRVSAIAEAHVVDVKDEPEPPSDARAALHQEEPPSPSDYNV
jgi:hypothetical protein